MEQMNSEVRDGMRIDWNVPIKMDDGVVLRADVFRPDDDGEYPVILGHGPYAKGLAFQEGFQSSWERLVAAFPDSVEGSSNLYQNWEVVDPEKWVPDGYVCVRVDSRGVGASPGYLDVMSPREGHDIYQSVEWAGVQPWSNGKVGLNGISYFAMVGWVAGAQRPPHLAAVCAWEGESDDYRELARHGGILSDFLAQWYPRQVVGVQYGIGEDAPRSRVTGELVTGPESLSAQERAQNRAAPHLIAEQRRLDDDYYRGRSPQIENMEVPLLSAANWGGQGLHTRGNIEGYLRAGSEQKWLEIHGDTHFSHFYSGYGEALQKQFFGHFLKGEDTGWLNQPKVSLNIRRPGEDFTLRAEQEWPLARTEWTKYYLRPDTNELSTDEPDATAALMYETTGDGLEFRLPVSESEIELTGPVAAKLWVSSDTTDADLFLVLSLFDPEGEEVRFIGSNDPAVPVGLGWLRASQRKLDPQRSKPYRPYHPHDEVWPLSPGVPVEVDVEIWPTCIAIPPGYQLVLNVRGKDYDGGADANLPHAPYAMRGVGPFTHTNEHDRPADVFGGQNTLHVEPGRAPYLLLPVIPQA